MSNKIINKSGNGCTAKFEYLETTVTGKKIALINKSRAE
jgi:hypothetical protein